MWTLKKIHRTREWNVVAKRQEVEKMGEILVKTYTNFMHNE